MTRRPRPRTALTSTPCSSTSKLSKNRLLHRPARATVPFLDDQRPPTTQPHDAPSSFALPPTPPFVLLTKESGTFRTTLPSAGQLSISWTPFRPSSWPPRRLSRLLRPQHQPHRATPPSLLPSRSARLQVARVLKLAVLHELLRPAEHIAPDADLSLGVQIIGLVLAIASGFFIGTSFVIKVRPRRMLANSGASHALPDRSRACIRFLDRLSSTPSRRRDS